MRVLVSGGPTHEFLDPVRFLGNPSTGAQGIAIAEVARDRGHTVELVLGPTHLSDPDGVSVTRVVSAVDMQAAMEARFEAADATLMTAAVSDYRPATRSPHKLKKGAGFLTLELTKNPDILSGLGKMPRHGVLVGFALEAAPPDEAEAYARGKLTAKNLDLVVCNRPGSFGGGTTEDVVLLGRDGSRTELGAPSKTELGQRLIVWCEGALADRDATG